MVSGPRRAAQLENNVMKKILVLIALSLLPETGLAGEQPLQELIQLFVKVYANGRLVSEPAVAMKAGTDASIMVGLDPDSPEWQGPGDGDGYVLKLTFHSTHLRDDGAEMLVDLDFGSPEAEHVQAKQLLMPWDETWQEQFAGEEGYPELRVEVLPTRASLEEFERRYHSGN